MTEIHTTQGAKLLFSSSKVTTLSHWWNYLWFSVTKVWGTKQLHKVLPVFSKKLGGKVAQGTDDLSEQQNWLTWIRKIVRKILLGNWFISELITL